MLQGLLESISLTPEKLFDLCDKDSSGVIDIEEVKNMLEDLKPVIQTKELRMIHNFLDVNNDGQVSRQEFIKRL